MDSGADAGDDHAQEHQRRCGSACYRWAYEQPGTLQHNAMNRLSRPVRLPRGFRFYGRNFGQSSDLELRTVSGEGAGATLRDDNCPARCTSRWYDRGARSVRTLAKDDAGIEQPGIEVDIGRTV